MTPEQQNTLRTFTANLRRAIRGRDAVRIGGGLFQPSELTPVVEALDSRRELLPLLHEAQPAVDALGALVVGAACRPPSRDSLEVLAGAIRAALAKAEGEQ